MTSSIEFSWLFVLLAIIGGFLPTIFWLWFWLQEDKKKPEPMRLIMKTFIIGGFFISLAFVLEKISAPNDSADIAGRILHAWENKSPWPILLISTWPIIIWALIEEWVKYLAARISALRNKNCDEPIDVMIYLVTAALGFAAVENFLFLLNVLLIDGHGSNTFLLTGNLRFLGATLLHVVASASLGVFLSFSFYQPLWVKRLAWLVGLLVATALHTLFNFFIIINDGGQVFIILIALWFATMIIIFLFEVVKHLNYQKIIIKPLNQKPYVQS